VQVVEPRSEAARRPLANASRVALVVALAHGLNDAYAAFLAPLLPRIMNRLDISIALAAVLAMTFSIAASLLQPLLGYWADRYGRRLFLVAGPITTGVFISLMGLAPGFWTLMLVLTMSGLGSAAFHPPGASFAARVSEGKGSGVRISIFSFGGNAGFALGPMIAVGLVQWRGLEGLWIAMIPVIVLTPFLWRSLPADPTDRAEAHLPPPPGQVLRHLMGPLGLIFGISAFMAFAQRAFVTMVPIIVVHEGGTETAGAIVLSTFLAAQAAGTLTGGYLADRMDRQRLLMGLCTLALPAHLLAVWMLPGGGLSLAAAAVAGFLGMATLPPIVVMAQEIVPSGAAVSSGIVMGLAWAAGSVGVLATGAAADAVGPLLATLATMPVILFAVLLASHPALRPGASVPEPA